MNNISLLISTSIQEISTKLDMFAPDASFLASKSFQRTKKKAQIEIIIFFV
jgi:hypothetical protein